MTATPLPIVTYSPWHFISLVGNNICVKSDATKQFGQRVRERREKLHLSQEAFADRVGLDRTYVSGIERGTRNPTLATMKRIAEGLGVLLEMLLKGL